MGLFSPHHTFDRNFQKMFGRLLFKVPRINSIFKFQIYLNFKNIHFEEKKIRKSLGSLTASNYLLRDFLFSRPIGTCQAATDGCKFLISVNSIPRVVFEICTNHKIMKYFIRDKYVFFSI